MRIVSFLATNAQSALGQIHSELGPDAVVVSVRQLPAEGLSRLWRRHGKLEVTACLPVSENRDEPARTHDEEDQENSSWHQGRTTTTRRKGLRRWRTIDWLESKGLLRTFVDQLEEKVYLLHGEDPPATAEQEWSAVTDLVICHWREARNIQPRTGRPHVFVGPPGSGKTTVLSKWMVASVLLNENTVEVWKLDGQRPHTDQILELHCESLSVPLRRFWQEPSTPHDFIMTDTPGVEIDDLEALQSLADQLALMPEPHVHLVLNAAYETSILMEQFKMFSRLKPEDIIFTHLDEEKENVKLWNFVLGTNCPISFLSSGQKVPGCLNKAEPNLLFPQKKSRKSQI